MIHLTDADNFKLLKTGQTTQYGGYPDDGFYGMGAAKQYDLLDAGVYAGTTDITINAKTDVHSNNCAYDRRTKLMWSNHVAASVGPAANGKLPWTTNVNGEGIFTFVAAANAALLAGYGDWRIPNIFELYSLCDVEVATAAPDAAAFPGWPIADSIYSSTTLPSGTANVLVVYFTSGQINSNAKTNNLFVALVRGG